MLFGDCLNIVTAANLGETHVLELAKKAKFDFIEANLTAIAQASDEEFEKTKAFVRERNISIPVCNCMFPKEIRLTAEGVDFDKISAYVDHAFARAVQLGVKKVVLGSDKSRQLPEGYDQDKAYDEMIAAVKTCIVPACEKYGITVLIEPLRRPCNFINTLKDGMRVVYGADHPQVKLLADTIHMITSGEDPAYVHEIKDYIQHVHVSDWNRALPEFGYSAELTRVLREIRLSGYKGTFSFEANPPANDFQLQRALLLLKQKLGA